MRTLLISLLLFGAVIGVAQTPQLLLKQESDQDPAEHLLASELAGLGDPFFLLVLKDHADETEPVRILDLIQPDASKRQVFVVDETIANPERRGVRRLVISFSGTHQGQPLDTNVMVSTFLTPTAFPAGRAIEVWGWDNQRGRYNYYKLDDSGTPDGRLVWKFRGSSVDADMLSVTDRAGTCMACHINGAPIMKELLFPWNNWHSSASRATYLTVGVTSPWPVASALRPTLRGAEDLEKSIVSAISQFNTRRLNASLARRDSDGGIEIDDQGRASVNEARRLLRHLFTTTEFNLISAKTLSGLHPFAPPPLGGPAEAIVVPAAFFLNANLIVGGGRYKGLGIAEAGEFGTMLRLTATEYSNLVATSGEQLGGRNGDANFAWLTPEPSHLDNDVVDRLLRRNVLSSAFVAAALAVDLEQPVLSAARERLLVFIPDTFQFTPNTPPQHPDELTKTVIRSLEAAAPAAGSPEARFLTLLRDPDPVQRLRERVIVYRDAQRQRLTQRTPELARLHQQLLERRAAVIDHEVLGVINETQDRLLPLPPGMRQQQTHFDRLN